MNVNKQTVVTVGQLKVISIKMPEKNPSKCILIKTHESSIAIGSENVNKRKWAGLSKCSVTLLRAKIRYLRDMTGEKEHGAFLSDRSEQ